MTTAINMGLWFTYLLTLQSKCHWVNAARAAPHHLSRSWEGCLIIIQAGISARLMDTGPQHEQQGRADKPSSAHLCTDA